MMIDDDMANAVLPSCSMLLCLLALHTFHLTNFPCSGLPSDGVIVRFASSGGICPLFFATLPTSKVNEAEIADLLPAPFENHGSAQSPVGNSDLMTRIRN